MFHYSINVIKCQTGNATNLLNLASAGNLTGRNIFTVRAKKYSKRKG